MYEIMFNNKLTLAEFFIYFAKYKGYLDLYNKKEKKDFNTYDKDVVQYIINNMFIYCIT